MKLIKIPNHYILITLQRVFVTLLITLFLYNCSSDNNGGTDPTPTTPTLRADASIITPTIAHQTISGFGGANRMWGTQSLKPAEAKKAFGLGENELGLSIFRVRISSNKDEWPIIVEAVKEANKYGATVLACPWSPPAALKSNNSDVGGYLLPENYEAFKDYINEYITYMASNGAIIDIVSIQNEPDWQVNYESCDYTANDFIQFFKAPGEIVGAKVAAPESLNFNQTMTNAILSDDIAANSIDIVAGHIYGGGTAKLPLAEQKNKEIWMTEYLLNLNTGNAGAAAWSTYSESAKWTESIAMLKSIHDSMMVNWNAYVWWYLQRYYSFIGDGEQGTVNGEVMKRGIGFSHFSKFIRPGYKRVEAIENPRSGIYVSAYTGEGKTIINAINISGSAVSQQFSIEGTSATSIIPYVTSETLSMQKQTSITIIPEIDGFNVSLPAKSITTFITN